jgi:predicted Zn-ribbon and HTH transcriptional regulator
MKSTRHIDYRCPKCQTGWMRPTGLTSPSSKFLHECNQCGYEAAFDIKYPHAIYE